MRTILGVLSIALPLAAHHSFEAMYDQKKPVTLQGVVTKVEWMNPHARYFLDVKDADGKVTNWALELPSPNGLMKGGWTRATIQKGDSVTVTGFRAKDDSNLAATTSVTLADGRVLKCDPHWGMTRGVTVVP